MIELEQPIRMSVSEYSQILGKKTGSITKHLRKGNALPYVISASKSPYFNFWILIVSPAIQLKKPLK